jgi:acetoin utilization deacetylase AcuC-like enzyme
MLRAKHKTGLVFFPAFDWAISPTHPEREERLLYTQDQVFEDGIFDIEGIDEFKPGLCTVEDIQRVHFCVPDVPAVTTESHLISAGGAKTIGKAVLDKKIERGFALVRPPGHHAMRVVHGSRGFCNVNIEAIMIEYLRQAYGIKKIAIVDTDCHHGDGTQDIYWHDPETLFISIHQDGRTLYPGSGFTNELGGPTAIGTTINIPLPPNTSEEGILYAISDIVLPILKDFKPELIVNSAGQDNHFSDPITNMNFSAQGYADLTTLLKPDIAVLEGGYSIEGALPYVNLGIILAMAGMDYSKVVEPDYDKEKIRQIPGIMDWIKRTGETVLTNWVKRERMKTDMLASNKFAERSRNIYYDTDNIGEQQKETLHACPYCAGALKIASSSDLGVKILGIQIPRNACKECIELGHEWFEAADKDSYKHIYLQNRPEDEYRVR